MLIKEHDIVELVREVDGIPEGNIGTVVYIHGDNEAYEVEFVACWSRGSIVKTVDSRDVRPMTGEPA